MGIGIMSPYEIVEEELQKRICKSCQGSGEKDDAEPGDISFRTWTCKWCGGTGFKNGKIYRLSKYETVK